MYANFLFIFFFCCYGVLAVGEGLKRTLRGAELALRTPDLTTRKA